jgi:hypothetical protein
MYRSFVEALPLSRLETRLPPQCLAAALTARPTAMPLAVVITTITDIGTHLVVKGLAAGMLSAPSSGNSSSTNICSASAAGWLFCMHSVIIAAGSIP